MTKLRKQTSNWPNIKIITDHLTDREALELIASVDCLVSLHRSEGFGLTISEAMWLGTAVIATNWSAPTEFIEGAAIAVPYRLIPVTDENGRYGISGQKWADPDLDFAASAMRRLRSDLNGRATLVSTARTRVIERLGAPIAPIGYERFLRRARQAKIAAE